MKAPPHQNKRSFFSACSAHAIKCFPFMTVVLFIAAISLPSLLLIISPLTGDTYQGHLLGYFDKPPAKTDFSIKAYINRDYQKNLEQRLNYDIGLRNYYIRVYNQIQFSLFKLAPNKIVGRNNDILEMAYIDAECGITDDFDFSIPQNLAKLNNYVDHLESIQKKLDSINKHFIFIITPSKATVNYENIPLKFRLKNNNFTPPYFYLKNILSSKQINYIDSREFLSKDSVPNFYTTGIHWARPLEQRVSQAIVDKMISLSNLDIPQITLKNINKDEKPYKRDADVFENANLIFKPSGTYYEYTTEIANGKNNILPKCLIQGGSFIEGFYFFDYADFSKESYKFFNNDVFRRKDEPDHQIYKKWEKVNFTEIIDNVDFVIIELNEAAIPKYSNGFVNYLDSFLDSYSESK